LEDGEQYRELRIEPGQSTVLCNLWPGFAL
jgi:hypothetical protein